MFRILRFQQLRLAIMYFVYNTLVLVTACRSYDFGAGCQSALCVQLVLRRKVATTNFQSFVSEGSLLVSALFMLGLHLCFAGFLVGALFFLGVPCWVSLFWMVSVVFRLLAEGFLFGLHHVWVPSFFGRFLFGPDLAKVLRLSRKKVLRLPRNLFLILRRCCACHKIST